MEPALILTWICFSIVFAFSLHKLIDFIFRRNKDALKLRSEPEPNIFQNEIGPNGEVLSIVNKNTQVSSQFHDSQNVNVVLSQFVIRNPEQISTTELTEKDAEYLKNSLRTVWSSENSWLIPLPWLEENMLPPEDYFVQLDLEVLSRDGFVSKGAVDLKDLLAPTDGNLMLNPKRVLVRGEVGYGKTTLCIKLAHVWSTEENSSLSHFDYALLFRFRDLPDCLENQSTESTLEEELIREFKAYVRPEINVDCVKSFLRRESEKILILLDGYDECKACYLDSVHRVLSTSDPLSTFFASTIIVTSRPLVNKTSHHAYFTKHIKITGLNSDSRNEFMERFFGTDQQFLEVLKKQLDLVHSSFGSSLSPFTLYLICFLYEERQLKAFSTHLELMRDLLHVLGKRCLEREPSLSHLTSNDVDIEYVKLGKVFYRSLRDGNIIIEQSFFDEVFLGDQTFVKSCGLLKKPLQVRRRQELSAWEPVHQSFMEYLSYFFLKFCLDNNIENEKRLNFISSLKLDLFDCSVVYKDQFELNLVVTVVTGVRLIFNIEVDPEQEVQLTDCNFMMLNNEMYTNYMINSGGCDVLKVHYQIRQSNDKYPSLCPFEIHLDDDKDCLINLAKSLKYFSLMNLRYPRHVFPEFVTNRKPYTLQKYRDNVENCELVLFDLNFGYNSETWPSFVFRIWLFSTLLLESANPFPFQELEGMTAATFFHRLLSCLIEARFRIDVVLSVICMGAFRLMCFYERKSDTLKLYFVDIFGLKFEKCVPFRKSAEELRESLKHVVFFEQETGDQSPASLCRLSGVEAESVLLFSSSLVIYEDPEMCATRLCNEFRSDFKLKFDLEKLKFPDGKSLVFNMYCYDSG